MWLWCRWNKKMFILTIDFGLSDYLVIDTHHGFPSVGKVLISPICLLNFNADWSFTQYIFNERNDFEDCPKVEEHETVRESVVEKILFDYFGYAYYWMNVDTWGNYAYYSLIYSQICCLLIAPAKRSRYRATNHLQSSMKSPPTNWRFNATGDNKGFGQKTLFGITERVGHCVIS